jgi:hypothetical protein
MNQNLSLEKIYPSQIIKVERIDGLANETISAGSTGTIIQKAFVTSLNKNFPTIANNLLKHFLKEPVENQANTILIRLKNKTEAHIYKIFPFSLMVRVRENVHKGMPVMEEHIADILSVTFKDDMVDLNPNNGEQFIWLFRSKWIFGLYFDLTGKLVQSKLLSELGSCWKQVNYLSEYTFMETNEYFEKMITDGWFPFIALRGNKLNTLMMYYEEGCKHKTHLDSIIDSFDEKTLNNITKNWWDNEHFKQKKQMITDAITAYINGVYTLSGKALSTELEGILRYAYNLDIASSNSSAKQKPSTFNLREYLKSKSQKNHSLRDSLSFPSQFIEYLEKYTFRGFDLALGDIPEGRNSVAHSVAPDYTYTKEFSLKAILALDNAYFFLGKTNNSTEKDIQQSTGANI